MVWNNTVYYFSAYLRCALTKILESKYLVEYFLFDKFYEEDP